MKDENERLEYVLNDSGIMYYGLEDYIKEARWNYGQFETGILDTCFQILNRSVNYQEDKVLDCSKRYDPGYVGRVVSAMPPYALMTALHTLDILLMSFKR
ncbi:unnamed protein product [Ranitomeya imitator]|uniref:Uncharacterized protein n=1 Tax=Ranitomeya imitator TaxID=111125 RepID=A0ABN9LRH8_9NEOB|nr:unnamed protein product [Ranitomeya imitator]